MVCLVVNCVCSLKRRTPAWPWRPTCGRALQLGFQGARVWHVLPAACRRRATGRVHCWPWRQALPCAALRAPAQPREATTLEEQKSDAGLRVRVQGPGSGLEPACNPETPSSPQLCTLRRWASRGARRWRGSTRSCNAWTTISPGPPSRLPPSLRRIASTTKVQGLQHHCTCRSVPQQLVGACRCRCRAISPGVARRHPRAGPVAACIPYEGPWVCLGQQSPVGQPQQVWQQSVCGNQPMGIDSPAALCTSQ